mmetsp:Transcript_12408/g.38295  ORF Transcript_12408/g.38295 Transcript_12408/m.38295 type:complete len:301 (-) Transcript_12408:1131-2033(-)
MRAVASRTRWAQASVLCALRPPSCARRWSASSTRRATSAWGLSGPSSSWSSCGARGMCSRRGPSWWMRLALTTRTRRATPSCSATCATLTASGSVPTSRVRRTTRRPRTCWASASASSCSWTTRLAALFLWPRVPTTSIAMSSCTTCSCQLTPQRRRWRARAMRASARAFRRTSLMDLWRWARRPASGPIVRRSRGASSYPYSALAVWTFRRLPRSCRCRMGRRACGPATSRAPSCRSCATSCTARRCPTEVRRPRRWSSACSRRSSNSRASLAMPAPPAPPGAMRRGRRLRARRASSRT